LFLRGVGSFGRAMICRRLRRSLLRGIEAGTTGRDRKNPIAMRR
jgi:hypothetical protein